MSGHSKWSTIKRKKGALDTKRGQIFTKISKMIVIAAQQGGADPDTNFSLRLAIEKAKSANMPKDNIERAIKKGAGEVGADDRLENIVYEGYGAGGVAILVDTTTDNKNRTVAEVRHIFELHGGSLGTEGAVSWQFEEKGLVTIKCAKLKKSEQFGKSDKEIPCDVEDVIFEIFDVEGVEDVYEVDVEEEDKSFKGIEVYCSKEDLYKVQTEIKSRGYVIVSGEIIRVPTNTVVVDQEVREKIGKLASELEDYDDVQAVWTNISEKE